MSRRETIALMALLLFGAAAIFWAGRFFDFWFDEWGIILYRRDGGLDALLAPHNGHLLLTDHLVYRLLFATVGLRHYWPYQAVMVGAHLIAAALVYASVRRKVPTVVAFVATASFLLLAYAWQVLLWPVDLNIVLPVIAFLGILLLRDRRSRWQEPATAALLLLAVTSSGLGIAVTAGIAVEKLAARDRVRQWWSVAVPSAVYGLWFVAVRPFIESPASLRLLPGAEPRGDAGATGFDRGNITDLPLNTLRAGRSAVVGLFGIAPGTHETIAIIVFAVVVAAIAIRRPALSRFVVYAVTATVYWFTLALSRGQLGELESVRSSRYLYAGSLLVLLMLVEVFAGTTRRTVAMVVALGLGALVLREDLIVLRAFRHSSVSVFAAMHARQSEVERDRASIDVNEAVFDPLMPGVRAGPYLAAIDDLGSPSPDDEGASRRRAAAWGGATVAGLGLATMLVKRRRGLQGRGDTAGREVAGEERGQGR